jgi:UDP-2,3-diacylglucosamine pyrophosphatase LpxH
MKTTTRANGKNLLIVSDFHMCEGRNPETGFYSIREDFFYDAEFADWLLYHQKKGNWHLIINGDLFDFQQIAVLPNLEEVEKFSLHIPQDFINKRYLKDLKKQSYYSYKDLKDIFSPDFPLDFYTQDAQIEGMGTKKNDVKFKLAKAIHGHVRLFSAIVDFMVAGNNITILKGNHDLELYWLSHEDVKELFIQECVEAWVNDVSEDLTEDEAEHRRRERLSKQPDAINAMHTQFRFFQHFYYEPEFCYIEHGNQYEAETAVRYPYYPELVHQNGDAFSPGIELDFSSFLVRYLINSVEKINPLSDNFRPRHKYFLWVLGDHPRDTFKILRKTFPRVMKVLKKESRESDKLTRKNNERREDTLDHFGISQSVMKEFSEMCASPTLSHSFFTSLMTLRLPQIIISGSAIAFAIVLILFRIIVSAAGVALSTKWVSVVSGILLIFTLIFALLAVGLILYWKWSARRKKRPQYRVINDSIEEQKRQDQILNHDPKPPFRAKAKCIYETLKSSGCPVKYVIFGHTHQADYVQLDANEGRYFNSGTWITIFDREEELIRNPKTLPYIEIVAEKARLRQWDGTAKRPKELIIQEVPG